MDRLDAGAAFGELARVDGGDAAGERLPVRPDDLDPVTGAKGPFDSRDAHGKEAASVTNDRALRPRIDDDTARDTFAVKQPQLERRRTLPRVEARACGATREQ